MKKLAHDQYSFITKGIVYYLTFYYSVRLTRSFSFNGSIYYFLSLQILRFYFVWQDFTAFNGEENYQGKYVCVIY